MTCITDVFYDDTKIGYEDTPSMFSYSYYSSLKLIPVETSKKKLNVRSKRLTKKLHERVLRAINRKGGLDFSGSPKHSGMRINLYDHITERGLHFNNRHSVRGVIKGKVK